MIAHEEGTLVVDVGLERTLRCKGNVPVWDRLTIRLTGVGAELTGEIVNPFEVDAYWAIR